jgi:hypothetical protein
MGEYLADEYTFDDTMCIDTCDTESQMISCDITLIPEDIFSKLKDYINIRSNINDDILYDPRITNAECNHYMYACNMCGGGRLSNICTNYFDDIIRPKSGLKCAQCGRKTILITYTLTCNCIANNVKIIEMCPDCWQDRML